jgi:hypothetical protein
MAPTRADDRGAVREDADDVGAAAELVLQTYRPCFFKKPMKATAHLGDRREQVAP